MNRALRLVGILLAALIVLFLTAFLVFSIYGSRKLERAEREYVSVFGETSLAELNPAEPPNGRNAATWLVAGSAAIVGVGGRDLPGHLSRTRAETWSEADRELAERTFEANGPALELLARVLDSAGSSFGILYTDGAYARLPNFLAMTKAHRLVLTRTRVALANGDVAGIAAGLELMAGFSDALSRESLLISALTVLHMDLGYLDIAREVLSRGIDDPVCLEKVDTTLAGMRRRDMLWRAFRAEGAVADSLSMATMEMAWGSPLLRSLGRPALRIVKAGFLKAPVVAAGRMDTPFLQWISEDPAPEERSFDWVGAVPIHPHLMNTIGKLQAQETVRQLAVEALRLRWDWLDTGSYPSNSLLPAADPLTGSSYERRVDPEGSLVLSAPRAEELFENGISTTPTFDDLFLWKLPAYSAAR